MIIINISEQLQANIQASIPIVAKKKKETRNDIKQVRGGLFHRYNYIPKNDITGTTITRNIQRCFVTYYSLEYF